MRRDGRPLALPPSRKTRALLGYLALAGRPQTRERLCDLLWEGPGDPRAALRWSLTKLRPLVDTDRRRLAADRDSVAVELGPGELDLEVVRALLPAGAAKAPIAPPGFLAVPRRAARGARRRGLLRVPRVVRRAAGRRTSPAARRPRRARREARGRRAGGGARKRPRPRRGRSLRRGRPPRRRPAPGAAPPHARGARAVRRLAPDPRVLVGRAPVDGDGAGAALAHRASRRASRSARAVVPRHARAARGRDVRAAARGARSRAVRDRGRSGGGRARPPARRGPRRPRRTGHRQVAAAGRGRGGGRPRGLPRPALPRVRGGDAAALRPLDRRAARRSSRRPLRRAAGRAGAALPGARAGPPLDGSGAPVRRRRPRDRVARRRGARPRRHRRRAVARRRLRGAPPLREPCARECARAARVRGPPGRARRQPGGAPDGARARPRRRRGPARAREPA